MFTDEIDHSEFESFRFPVAPGAGELRATLVWHDPMGTSLVNDLDLLLVSPGGGNYQPFVLDPSQPTAAATQGRNANDNVESIRVDRPGDGWWQVRVEGWQVAEGPQSYSLMVSVSDGNHPPEKKLEGSVALHDLFTTTASRASSATPSSSFHAGDPLNLFITFSVTDNANYGDFLGSFALNWALRDSENINRPKIAFRFR